LAAAVFAGHLPVFGQLQDVAITAQKKRLDQQKERVDGNATVTTQELIYVIGVQNKRFQPQPQVVVKYAIYLEDEKGGSTEKGVARAHRGEETLKDLAANATVTFETKPFQLSKEELDAGWVYTSGAGSRAKDRVQGIWIRAYDASGKMIGEYANPSTVAKKNVWKD
jgi:hypothetical protein